MDNIYFIGDENFLFKTWFDMYIFIDGRLIIFRCFFVNFSFLVDSFKPVVKKSSACIVIA